MNKINKARLHFNRNEERKWNKIPWNPYWILIRKKSEIYAETTIYIKYIYYSISTIEVEGTYPTLKYVCSIFVRMGSMCVHIPINSIFILNWFRSGSDSIRFDSLNFYLLFLCLSLALPPQNSFVFNSFICFTVPSIIIIPRKNKTKYKANKNAYGK